MYNLLLRSILQSSNQPSEKYEKPYRFTCQQCGKCCSDKDTIVNLTYTDILRIQSDKNLSLEELLSVVGYYIYENEPTEDQLQKMVVPPILTQRGPAFLGLRKNSEGKCVYLSETNQCTIYQSRPAICRSFPFHFHYTPVPKPEKRIDIEMTYATKAIKYCPGIGTPFPLVNAQKWLHTGETTLKDLLKEIILIKQWNEAVEAKKIVPSAENYLKSVLNIPKHYPGHNTGKNEKKGQKNTRKSYQDRVRQKLPK